MAQPTRAEDPFSDIPSYSLDQDNSTNCLWSNNKLSHDPICPPNVDQDHHQLPPPIPTRVKILKRRTVTELQIINNVTASTTEELNSRAKEKEQQYQRARERILGNDSIPSTNSSSITPPPTTDIPFSYLPIATSSGTNRGLSITPPIHVNDGRSRSRIDMMEPDDEDSDYQRYPVAYVTTSGTNSTLPVALIPTSSTITCSSSSSISPTSSLSTNYFYPPVSPPSSLCHSSIPNHPNTTTITNNNYDNNSNNNNMPMNWVPPPYMIPVPQVFGWDPYINPPIGYVNLPGIPAWPIPPPPNADFIRLLNLPSPRTIPPFPIYVPPHLPPQLPFIWDPIVLAQFQHSHPPPPLPPPPVSPLPPPLPLHHHHPLSYADHLIPNSDHITMNQPLGQDYDSSNNSNYHINNDILIINTTTTNEHSSMNTNNMMSSSSSSSSTASHTADTDMLISRLTNVHLGYESVSSPPPWINGSNPTGVPVTSHSPISVPTDMRPLRSNSTSQRGRGRLWAPTN